MSEDGKLCSIDAICSQQVNAKRDRKTIAGATRLQRPLWPLFFAMDTKGAADTEIASLQSRQEYLSRLAEQRCAREAVQTRVGKGAYPAFHPRPHKMTQRHAHVSKTCTRTGNARGQRRATVRPPTPSMSAPLPTLRWLTSFISLRAIAAKVLELFRSLDQPPLADLPFFVGCRRVTQEVDFVTCHFRRLRSLLGTHSCPLGDRKPQLDQPADGFGARWMVLL